MSGEMSLWTFVVAQLCWYLELMIDVWLKSSGCNKDTTQEAWVFMIIIRVETVSL